MREWYQSGYIIRDAATTDMNKMDYLMAGMTCGYFADGQDYLRASAEMTVGEEFVQLELIDPHYPSFSSAGNVYWSVPVSAANPEGALRFLDLMFKDKDVVNMLLWGLEGRNWVFTDKDRGLIGFPEGKDANNNGFYNPYGVYGNTLMCYVNDESLLPDALIEFGKKALANPTKGVGFCYDSSNMTTQIMAVTSVVTEYMPALCTGTADLDRTYPEFIQRLKQSGIDDIIADKQAQFDAWVAARS
jgi:putative aldouronate transport system substrate-binding protein